MRLVLRSLAGITATLLLVYMVFSAVGPGYVWNTLTGPADMGRYDFAMMSRNPTGNDALACSPGLCGSRADFDLPVHNTTPADLIRQLDVKILSSGESVRRVDDGSDATYARYVTHSPWMGFPDTTDVEAVDMGNGQAGLRSYARAKIGKDDFGANAARLRRWLQ